MATRPPTPKQIEKVRASLLAELDAAEQQYQSVLQSTTVDRARALLSRIAAFFYVQSDQHGPCRLTKTLVVAHYHSRYGYDLSDHRISQWRLALQWLDTNGGGAALVRADTAWTFLQQSNGHASNRPTPGKHTNNKQTAAQRVKMLGGQLAALALLVQHGRQSLDKALAATLAQVSEIAEDRITDPEWRKAHNGKAHNGTQKVFNTKNVSNTKKGKNDPGIRDTRSVMEPVWSTL